MNGPLGCASVRKCPPTVSLAVGNLFATMVAALIVRPGAGFVVSLAALLAALAWPSEVLGAEPPPGLTASGRSLWEFEALLRDTFHNLPVSAHYDQGKDWRFATCGRIACAPLSYWSIYFFSFKGARGSTFHLARRRSIRSGTFGNYPVPIKVKNHYVACDRSESRFLITYGSAVGLDLACLSIR